jgi:hypothetical protein
MSTFEEVGARLESLERTNRRLRGAAAVLLAGLVAVAAVAMPGRGRVARTVEAQRLVIRDNDGRIRGSFGVDRIGLPGLKILDHRGLEQIDIGVQSDDSATMTFSDRGSPRLMIDTSAEGATSLRLFDRSQMLQAAFFIKPNGEAELSMGQGGRTVNLTNPPVAAAMPKPVMITPNTTSASVESSGAWVDEGGVGIEAETPNAVGGMGY